MPEEAHEIVVKRSVWEMAQDVTKRLPEIEGSFERTFADWGWDAAYAKRQAEMLKNAGDEQTAEQWYAVERFFMTQECLDAGTVIRIVED
jgi:hypothetical protein